MKLAAMSGYARSGKDTAANALQIAGWQRIAFADILREFLLNLDPIVGTRWGRKVRLLTVIDKYGWDGYKETRYGPEIRKLLQLLGTECGRELLGADVWVNATLDNLSEGDYVISDCRFPNEAAAIKERGGKVFRVVRKGIGPANSHSSETSLDNYTFDDVIHNNGTIEDFRAAVRRKVLDNWV